MNLEEVYDSFVSDLSTILREKLRDLELSKIIFLCIGTDKVIGDSFGPLVGYKLEKLFRREENIEIIGTLKSIVCMQNISSILANIKNTYKEPFLIAIDAALSNNKEIGKIIVSKEKLNIGGAFGRRNILVGDISIKGIISRDFGNPKYNFKILQNTSLGLVVNMADIVASRNI